MFSGIKFRINGAEIFFELHEMVHIAKQVIEKSVSEPVPVPDYSTIDQQLNNEFQQFSTDAFDRYEKHFGIKSGSLSYHINHMQPKDQRHDNSFDPLEKVMLKIKLRQNNKPLLDDKYYKKLLLPTTISGMNSVSTWLYVANFFRIYQYSMSVKSWSFDIGGRLILLSNDLPSAHTSSTEKKHKHLYCSDHGPIDDIISNVRDCAKYMMQFFKNPRMAGGKVVLPGALESFRYTILVLIKEIANSHKSGNNHSKYNTLKEVHNIMHPEDANKYILHDLLSRLSKEVALGKRELLYRPIKSYGSLHEGDTYPDFERSIAAYFQKPTRLNSQELAVAMRRLLKGEELSYSNSNDLSFLPNLTGAWFISEAARNNASILTGLMLLDMIESNTVLPTENGDNWYSWKHALIHPHLSHGDKKVNDLYQRKINILEFGGSHPMVQQGSYEQANTEMKSEMPLTPVRQKEGSLIIHWLSEHLSKHFPAGTIEIIQAKDCTPTMKPVYNEIVCIDDGEYSAKYATISKKISKLNSDRRRYEKADPKNMLEETKKLIAQHTNEINYLLQKSLLQKHLLEPLLALRLSSLDRMHANNHVDSISIIVATYYSLAINYDIPLPPTSKIRHELTSSLGFNLFSRNISTPHPYTTSPDARLSHNCDTSMSKSE